ncbi:MAG TPA: S41 family peptidase [Blastocatellia bacterium]|nr:S41 family peptidase [Blastocatellia bacterium]
MQFRTKIAIVVFSTIIAFYAIVGSFMSKSGQAVAKGSQYAQLTIFDEVLALIIRDYVDQPDIEKVRIGSLRGLAEGLDPYSAYLTPEQVKQYDPKAVRSETGMVLSKVGGYAYIVTVVKGSPADQAGIRDGDFIEYVGKVPSRDLSLYDIHEFLSGQPGTSVEVRILHRGQSRKVSVARVKIAQPAIESRLEEPGIGYIRVTSLNPGKASEVKSALKDLMAKGGQKVALDLRGTASGSMEEALAVANLFIGSGTLARVIGKNGKETQAYNADAAKVVFSGPLVVVMDRSTAGPGEVIAAAIRDQKRGELVGERSFGAGSEQQLFYLSDGGALLITTAKYAPVAGKPFMDEPISPTVKVERPVVAEVVIPGGDDDQDAEEKPEQPQAVTPKPLEPPVDDVMFKKALEVLKQASAKTQSVGKRATVWRVPARIGVAEGYRIST